MIFCRSGLGARGCSRLLSLATPASDQRGASWAAFSASASTAAHCSGVRSGAMVQGLLGPALWATCGDMPTFGADLSVCPAAGLHLWHPCPPVCIWQGGLVRVWPGWGSQTVDMTEGLPCVHDTGSGPPHPPGRGRLLVLRLLGHILTQWSERLPISTRARAVLLMEAEPPHPTDAAAGCDGRDVVWPLMGSHWGPSLRITFT